MNHTNGISNSYLGAPGLCAISKDAKVHALVAGEVDPLDDRSRDGRDHEQDEGDEEENGQGCRRP